MKEMLLRLDDLDYDAIQRAMARRQTFRVPGCEGTILPTGESDLPGALVAEICRGWLEMLDWSHH